MEKTSYIKLSSTQIEKVGNAIVYLTKRIPNLSKTKTLKLIYILDELAIRKSGIPYFNLKYKVWKFGPVSEEIFIDLSSETTLLRKYIERSSEEGTNSIIPIAEFDDNEFSDNDIALLEFVIEEFGGRTAKDLVSYTHRKKSPWHNTALENSVLDLLESEEINNTELLIDMGSLVNHDERKKAIYDEFQESH